MKIINKSLVVLSVLIAGGVGGLTSAFAETVIVVSSKNAATSLTKDQASAIFMGKNSEIPGGGQVVPIDQVDGPLREEFYIKTTGKSTDQMRAYWSKLEFTGKGTAPKQLANSAEVKKFLSANPNGIGYIDRSAVDSSVKIVYSL